MSKKVVLCLVSVMIIILLGALGGIFIKKINAENNNLPSGEAIEPDNKEPIDYVDINNGNILEGFLERECLNVYAPVQEIRLEEVELKEYFWTMQAENLDNVEIDSGETEFVYFEHGVGEAVDRVYKIKGVKEGETILRFDASYRQKQDKPLVYSQTVIYKVTVNADKQVAITEEIRFIPNNDIVEYAEY